MYAGGQAELDFKTYRSIRRIDFRGHVCRFNNVPKLSCGGCSSYILPLYLPGVQPGDVITELEGNDIADFKSFQPFLAAIGRPVRITFFRRAAAANSTGATSSSSSSSSSQPSSSSSSSSSVVSDLYKTISSSFGGMSSSSSAPSGDGHGANGNANSSNASSNALSEEERQARRNMLSKAANDRTWEKQSQAKRAAKKQQVNIFPVCVCMNRVQ